MLPEGTSSSPADGGRVTGEQLRLLADANIIGIVVATNDGIVEANDAFLSIIGYTRADFTGHIDWQALTPPEYAERDQLGVEELRLRGVCTPFEKEFWRKDSTRAPVLIGAALLQRDPMRWICFVQDISAQKQLEFELRQAAAAFEMSSRAKDDFVNMLVHELRQPLSTMSMAALLLKTGLQHDPIRERLRRPLEVLDNQIASLTRLTDELLLASRIVRGAMPLRRVNVDFSAVVDEVIGDERMRAEAAGLTLVLDPAPSPVIVNGDPMRLRHVVANIVGNAIKYTRPGGGVRVTVVQGDSNCELHVKDTGVGIGPEELPYVFEPFRRGSQEGSGFGIGLAVVKSVVEQHGGSVEIVSAGRNQGTDVTVRLPVNSPA